MKNSKKLWTKKEIRTFITLWDSKTTEEIATELNRPKSSMNYIAMHIRKSGYNLPKKHNVGKLDGLIKETLQELKLI